jgi:hypothetical protein
MNRLTSFIAPKINRKEIGYLQRSFASQSKRQRARITPLPRKSGESARRFPKNYLKPRAKVELTRLKAARSGYATRSRGRDFSAL